MSPAELPFTRVLVLFRHSEHSARTKWETYFSRGEANEESELQRIEKGWIAVGMSEVLVDEDGITFMKEGS